MTHTEQIETAAAEAGYTMHDALNDDLLAWDEERDIMKEPGLRGSIYIADEDTILRLAAVCGWDRETINEDGVFHRFTVDGERIAFTNDSGLNVWK